MLNNLKLSVIIPTYNEERRIPFTLKKIVEYLSNQKYKYEIIIVDDGSKDRTVEIVAEIAKDITDPQLIKIEKNRGKGYAIKTGILKAKGEYVLFMDADYATGIEEIEKCYLAFNAGYDIAIGSRRLSESIIDIHQPFYREFMGKVFRILASRCLMISVSDITCGFKCFKREVARNIFGRQKLDRWGFDAEILFIAKKYAYKIKEIPVRWKNSGGSKVLLSLDTIRSFIDIVKIFIYNFENKY